MRRATENQGDARTLADYFPQRSKVKDLALQQCSLPHFASFLQETPMKPSQVPNQLPHPPLRKMLPPQSPEMCHRDRLGPPRHPHHPLGPIYSSGYPPNSPTTMSTSPNRHHPMQRDRPGPPAHSAQPPAFIPSSPQNRPHPMARHRLSPLQHSAQPPGSFSPRLVPVSPTHSGTTFNRSYPLTPRGFQPATPQFMKDLSNHSPPSHIRRDEGMESKVNSSHSGSRNVTAQTQESNKAQSSDLRNPVQTVQLHRPPMTPPFNARAAQDVCPPSISHSAHWSPGNSQRTLWGYGSPLSTQSPDRSSSSSLQDQHHKQTPSSEKLIPAVDLNDSSQKRHRDLEDCDAGAKKLCLQGANSGKAQTPKPIVGTSLSTSLSQPSSSHSTALEPSTKTTESHLSTEPCGQTNFVGLSSSFKPAQSSSCIKRRPSMGAQQAYINSTQNQTVLIELTATSKPGEVSLRKRGEGNDNMEKSSSLLSSEVPPQDPGSSPHFQLSRQHLSGRANRSPSDTQVKTPSRGNRSEESRKSDSTTPKSASKLSLSGRKAVKHKTGRPRRPVIAPYDINELFTPDPMTYVVTPAHKAAKPKTDGETVKSHTSENNCSSSSSAPVTGSSCHKTQNVTVTGSSHAGDAKATSASLACSPQVSFPTVALQRVKLEDLRAICSKSSELKTGPLASSGRQLRDESVKSDEKHTSLLPNNVRPCALENDSVASEQTSASHCSKSPQPEKQANEGSRKQASEEDPIDVELDLGLGLSFTLDLDLTHSSQSSEDEQLLSLQEMMERVTKPPDTPDKGAFSEPSTPGHHNCQSKTLPLPSTTKPGIYKNNLDQMLKEINTNKKAKEIETQLLTACKEDLLRIAEYEEAEENREEGISTEHQEFLQRYSLMSNAIREVPPGEVVFNLEKFGRIFNQDTLQLRQCMVNPQEMAQKTLLWSSPAQLRLHLNIGLFQEAYDSHSPCPTQVTRFLFKMMSVHSERLVSDKLLQALCDIACTAAYQIVKHGNQQFKVWVPSLADVALVLMNMGVAFVTLFPFENLQPQFTEGDLLEDIYIKSESHSSNKDQSTFPEHNCNNILKYLSYCMGLCPRAYSDEELLLLLTVVGRLGLDTRLILQSSVELYPLQGKIVNNIRDWDNMLPRICLALTDLSDDHHNMCLLVQILPDNTRGKQLRRHLSLSMISKLLDGHCTYRPKGKEIQLSELRLYLPRMQPSTLVRGMMSSSIRSQKDKEDDMATLDQQSYYLCYSLLTLANEASNFQFFPAHQKEQLLILCSELETHVKCDIRESEKCLYRSKVKDLVARIYTKWQMLLQRTRPLHGKLYDYWTPLSVDKFTRSQEEQEVGRSNDEEGLAMEEDVEEETSGTEENELLMIADDDEERADGEDAMDDKRGGDTKPKETEDELTMDAAFKMVDNTKPEEMDRDGMLDETLKTGDETKPEDVEEDDTMVDIFKMVEDMKPEEVEGEYTTDETFETVENTKPEEMEGDGTLDNTNEMEGVTELGQEMEPQGTKESHVIDEQIEAGKMQRAEVETENLVETREAAACDLVS